GSNHAREIRFGQFHLWLSLRIFIYHFVYHAMIEIPHFTVESISLTMSLINKWQYKLRRDLTQYKHVMLYDEVIPVSYPNCAIGSDGRLHRAEPFVRAGHKIPAILLCKTCPIFFNDGIMY